MRQPAWVFATGLGLAFVAFAVVLIWLAVRLVRDKAAAAVASLPLVAEQEASLDVDGELSVGLQTPRHTLGFKNIVIEITPPGAGRPTRLEYSSAAATISGVSTTTFNFGTVDTKPGMMRVRAIGLSPGRDYSAYRIQLAHPYLARMAAQIFGIVICAVGMLLCVLFTVWRFVPLQGDTNAPTAKPAYPTDAGVPGKTIDLETFQKMQRDAATTKQ